MNARATIAAIRAPLIVSGPGVKHAGAINPSALHVMDILPPVSGVGRRRTSVEEERRRGRATAGEVYVSVNLRPGKRDPHGFGLTRLGAVRQPSDPERRLEAPVLVEWGRGRRRLGAI